MPDIFAKLVNEAFEFLGFPNEHRRTSRAASRMSKNSKLRLVLVSAAALLLGCAFIFFAWRQPPTYWAYSAILMKPYTNAVFGRPFERQIIKEIPAVRKLEVTPGFATPSAVAAWSTNRSAIGTAAPVIAQIRIMALGSTPQEARNAANDAAAQVRVIVERQYGGKAIFTQQADRTGRWLVLYEVKLRLARLLHVDL